MAQLSEVRRVAYVAPNRFPTEKAHGYQIMKMCDAMSRIGIEVTLFHPKRRQNDDALGRTNAFDYYGIDRSFGMEELPNVDVLRIERFVPSAVMPGLVTVQSLLWARYAVGRAAKSAPDLYYTRDPAVAHWTTRRGLPTLFEIHGIPERVRKRWVVAALRRPRLERTAVLTTALERMVVDLGAPPSRVVVAPDGVDAARFRNLPDRSQARAHLSLPDDRPIVGYVGRFQTMGMEKGITDLIGAAARIEGALRPRVLCVGGPLDGVPGYERYASNVGLSRDDVVFHDRVPPSEVPLWIRACDVVTIPWPATNFSMYFTSPMKLFEYMAAGAAIVASDLPALRDVLRHEENALLTPPDDVDGLARTLQRLLSDYDLRLRIATRAQQESAGYEWTSRAARIFDRGVAA
ncbi:MAG TPA: glycosyltransferase family 4 protein [Actinomycetota bacterium]|nr:glycosyltransferase family 4 protein [Actinomycetota bacterium]